MAWKNIFCQINSIWRQTTFSALSFAFLMALIEEDIWGAGGQRLFVCLREKFLSVWVDRYLDREQSKVSRWREFEKKCKARSAGWWKTGGQGESREQLGEQPFYSTCEGLNKLRQKKTNEPIQEPKQHPRLASLDKLSLLRIDLQQTALFNAE